MAKIARCVLLVFSISDKLRIDYGLIRGRDVLSDGPGYQTLLLHLNFYGQVSSNYIAARLNHLKVHITWIFIYLI